MPFKVPPLKGQIAAIVACVLAALGGAGAAMGFDLQEDAVHIILYGKVIVGCVGIVCVMIQNCVTTIVTGRAPPSFLANGVGAEAEPPAMGARAHGGQR